MPNPLHFTWTNIFTFSNVTVKETLGLAGFQQQQLVGLGELIHIPTENITGRQSENKAAARPACPALAIGDNGQACLDDVLGVRRAGDKRTRRTDVCSPRHSVCPSSAWWRLWGVGGFSLTGGIRIRLRRLIYQHRFITPNLFHSTCVRTCM